MFAVLSLSLLPVVSLVAALGDHDNDGVPDNLDLDHDNDGIPNTAEGYVLPAATYTPAEKQYRPVAPELATAIPLNQVQGSAYHYPLIDISSNQSIGLQGTILSTTTTLNWANHQNIPKPQHENAGYSVIRWVLASADLNSAEKINVDLQITDLDSDRNETIIVQRQSIIAYSLAENSALTVIEGNDGTIEFSAAAASTGLSFSDSVGLHVRDQDELVIGYKSSQNTYPVSGVNGNRAGFRHEFSTFPVVDYFPLVQQRDTDNDGVPDHLDLDSDNDGLTDVAEASGVDQNQDGIADGAVSTTGIPATAAGGLVVADINNNGISDPHDIALNSVLPVADGGLPEGESTIASPYPDADNDGLSDDQELHLGTDPNLSDTDGDGFSDRDEVVVFHSNPLIAQSQDPSYALHHTEHVQNDSDNDGVADSLETLFDQDGDGVPNSYDLDSDNDGLPDILEAGLKDVDSDGQIDAIAGSVGIPVHLKEDLADFDLDGIANMFDLDSDQDGISDLIETSGSDKDQNGLVDVFVDVDGNGWSDIYYGTTPVIPDSDGDGALDYLDSDQSILQSDAAMSGNDAGLVTGLGGGAGCTLNVSGKQHSLSLLLLLAMCGQLYRSSDRTRKRC